MHVTGYQVVSPSTERRLCQGAKKKYFRNNIYVTLLDCGKKENTLQNEIHDIKTFKGIEYWFGSCHSLGDFAVVWIMRSGAVLLFSPYSSIQARLVIGLCANADPIFRFACIYLLYTSF